MFIFKGAWSFTKVIGRLFRFGIASGLALVAVLFTIDGFTNPSYGVANLYLIVWALSFFPLLVGLAVEFFFMFLRRSQKSDKKKEAEYLKESTEKNSVF